MPNCRSVNAINEIYTNVLCSVSCILHLLEGTLCSFDIAAASASIKLLLELVWASCGLWRILCKFMAVFRLLHCLNASAQSTAENFLVFKEGHSLCSKNDVPCV